MRYGRSRTPPRSSSNKRTQTRELHIQSQYRHPFRSQYRLPCNIRMEIYTISIWYSIRNNSIKKSIRNRLHINATPMCLIPQLFRRSLSCSYCGRTYCSSWCGAVMPGRYHLALVHPVAQRFPICVEDFYTRDLIVLVSQNYESTENRR